MASKKYVLFFFLVLSALIVTSCAKPECKIASDCPSSACSIARCDDGQCKSSVKPNCCGNRLKDALEDGKPGNSCTCPQDYGKCEGKGKVTIGSRKEDATYLRNFCNAENQCIMGVEKSDVLPQNFLDSLTTGYFKGSIIAKYNKPFDTKTDIFNFVLSIDDANKDLMFPMRLTRVKVLFSGSLRTELLISEKDLDSELNGVGDEVVVGAPLNLDYRPSQPEESGSMRYIIDYEYTKRTLTGKTLNGTSIYTKELVRSTFQSPSKPIFFVKPE